MNIYIYICFPIPISRQVWSNRAWRRSDRVALRRDNNESRSSCTAVNIPSAVRFYLSTFFLIRSLPKGGQKQRGEQRRPTPGIMVSCLHPVHPLHPLHPRNRCARYSPPVERVEVARESSRPPLRHVNYICPGDPNPPILDSLYRLFDKLKQRYIFHRYVVKMFLDESLNEPRLCKLIHQ